MICTKCKKTVRVISKFLDEQLTNALDIAHAVTNEVAKVIDNPLFQLLASQLPAGTNKDAILATIEKVLSTTNNILTCEHLTGIDKINCLMNVLNILPKDERNSILLRLKSALTAQLDGNRFVPFVYDTAAQLNYLNEKIKAGAGVEAGKDYVEIVKDEKTEQLLNVVQIAEEVFKPTGQAANQFAQPMNEKPVEAPPTPQAF